MFSKKALQVIVTSITAATLLISTASAEDKYPSKAISYIIPFSAGGESDISARFQQASSEKAASASFVIQYMDGAGGATAWAQLNGMAGDGYTIMGINVPHTILQPMAKDVGYKTKDLVPVNYFHYTPDAIFVPKDSEFKTLQDLIDHAKKNPGAVTFAGSGSQSSNNVAQVRLDELAGITTTYIPFKGTGPSMTALLGKQTTAGFVYATSGNDFGDQVRMLAVAAETRLPAFPDVPTFKELGIDMVGGAYRGVAVPASASEEIRQQVSDVVTKINNAPDFRKKMEDGGFVLTDIPYSKVNAFVDEKTKEYTAIADKLGLKK